MYNLVIRRKK